MHLIKDENGNICAHGHEDTHTHAHSHAHTHEHSHEDGHGHAHSHEHSSDHSCNHEHPHGHVHEAGCQSCSGCAQPANKNEALLGYMLAHNQSHAAELDKMGAKLRESGMEAAAEQIKKAVDEFQKGNMYLGVALAMVKEQQ